MKSYRFPLLIALCIGAGFTIAAVPSPAALPPKVETVNGKFALEVQDVSLDAVLSEIHSFFNVSVTGLETRLTETVSLDIRGKTPEALLKRLFRHLGVKNYAFAYSEKGLAQATVFPESTATGPPPPPEPETEDPQPSSPPPDPKATAVEVLKVLPDSQAEAAGLQQGDIVIEYDGVMINSSRQLVSEVKKKSDAESVTLVILRDELPLTYQLSGGQIGIQIRTAALTDPDQSP